MLRSKSLKHYLAVSVSYKSDLWNLLEFIEYHRLVGVSHFYICNNDDNPAFSSHILESYVSSGIVTHIPTAKMFKGTRNRQRAAHQFCLRIAKNKVKWLALLDMDEFLYPVKCDSVPQVLMNYTNFSSVVFNYTCFGSSHLFFRPQLQTESYVYRAPNHWKWNKLCKAIGQVQKVKDVQHHHYFDKNMVDENKRRCDWVKPYTANVLRINHYLSRSRQDYQDKMRRGNPLREKRDWRWFHWADRNDILDVGMKDRFVDRLREALQEKGALLRKSRHCISLI